MRGMQRVMIASEKHILIVDHDADAAARMAGRLAEVGLHCEIARSGREALEALGEFEPVLMVLDLGLPDITGEELLEELRRQGYKIPFIVVAEVSDTRLTVRMMKLGALDFLTKDGSIMDLVAPVIQKAIANLKVLRGYEDASRRLEQISEHIADAFWMVSPDWKKVLYVSPAFERIWGHPVESLYADINVWTESVVEDDRSKVTRSFTRLLDEREDEHEEVYRIRDSAGGVRWIRARIYAIRAEDGEILNFAGISSDITELKDLQRQAVHSSENERARIGRDIHDDLCQRLAALGMRCGILERSSVGLSEEARSLVSIIGKEIAGATKLSRSIARGLSPVSLDAEGLMLALGQLAEDTTARFGMRCGMDCPVPVEIGDPAVATHVFRIAQELVTNAAKHARPRRILICLYEVPGGFRLEVSNDGRPFYGPRRRRQGMGLHFVQFRADAIGAAIEFCPGDAPDGGTRVLCTVPFNGKQEEME